MLKHSLSLFLLLSFFSSLEAQKYAKYEVSPEHPYGQIHPEAPEQLADFAPMIGRCKCASEKRNPDGTWQNTVAMTWQFKYIMNGLAVQDESGKADGVHSGSIRQFNADSSLWYVSSYSSASSGPGLSTWSGKKEGNDIVLYLAQKAPNGMDGFSYLTFYDISEQGFKWKGEWIDISETIVYPFWRIDCKKEGATIFRPD